MSQAYISQVTAFGFGFAPKNWALCNGQTLSISQNAALFSLLGTTYGGNGVNTFALPNLQSRVMLHFGQAPDGTTYTQGEINGAENVTLITSTMGAHNHAFFGTTDNADSAGPIDGAALATIAAAPPNSPGNFYSTGAVQPLNPAEIANTGGSQSHPNIQPYLTISWCICLFGIFPSRN